MGYTFRFCSAGGVDAVESEFGDGRTAAVCCPPAGRGGHNGRLPGIRALTAARRIKPTSPTSCGVIPILLRMLSDSGKIIDEGVAFDQLCVSIFWCHQVNSIGKYANVDDRFLTPLNAQSQVHEGTVSQ